MFNLNYIHHAVLHDKKWKNRMTLSFYRVISFVTRCRPSLSVTVIFWGPPFEVCPHPVKLQTYLLSSSLLVNRVHSSQNTYNVMSLQISEFLFLLIIFIIFVKSFFCNVKLDFYILVSVLLKRNIRSFTDGEKANSFGPQKARRTVWMCFLKKTNENYFIFFLTLILIFLSKLKEVCISGVSLNSSWHLWNRQTKNKHAKIYTTFPHFRDFWHISA